MDKTETYTKMCDHPAIQDKAPDGWDEPLSMEFHQDVLTNEKTIEGFTKYYTVWTPRPDQWIGPGGLIDGEWRLSPFPGGKNFVFELFDPPTGAGSTYCPVRDYYGDTPEQACCLAYMAQQGYRWGDNKWEATE